MSEPNKQPVQAMPLRLEGWKQIAAYMNRDVSTVQRWEKQAGLLYAATGTGAATCRTHTPRTSMNGGDFQGRR